MAKKVDLRAAKAAKQKKIAIVGAVLLVGLLVFQVPRTMKMLGGGEPVEAAPVPAVPEPAPAADGTVPLAPPTLDGTTPAPAEGTPISVGAEPAGTLLSFERFESKDPFAAQIRPGQEGPPTAAAPPTPGETGDGDGGSLVSGSPAEPGGGDEPRASLSRAEIEVNGAVETVQVSAEFPAANPAFALVGVAKGSVKIGVAGGTLASGDATVTLRKAEPLTLVNTADGTRYRLRLISVS